MAIDQLGRNIVLVGVRLDSYSRELLDWAVVKVAEPGDVVVAVHVSWNSDRILKDKALLDGYLEDYHGICTQKQVTVSYEVYKGFSMRKALVREAKKQNASAIIVGISKRSAFERWASIAKYCANKLPLGTEVMAVHNGKVVSSRCSTHQFAGRGSDPKPSFCLNTSLTCKDNQSECGESETSEMSRFSFDFSSIRSKAEALSPFIRRLNRGLLSSISLPVEELTNQKPGWPLLQTSCSMTRPSVEARNMSVVQWVMNLPHRSLSGISETSSPLSSEDFAEGENGHAAEMTRRNTFACGKGLPKDLELVLANNLVDYEIFSRDVLRQCTSEFSSDNLIGNGGCNYVYKGILPEGKPVAVKILESSKDAWKDFTAEVEIMAKLNHKSITPLLGICIEDSELISVYDFLSRGNLEENLHSDGKTNLILSWEKRFRIAVEIAEALNYLHHECERPVIHRDVKSSNILLRDNFEAQLSDFGLAMWGPTTSSFLMDSDVVGTFGYLAPEYFMYGKVSNKIDVYAFGVVLLELLSGKKPIGLEGEKSQESLVMWAKPKLDIGDVKSILDPNLDCDVNETQTLRMTQAAALCLTQSARLRPDMCQILKVLNGEESLEQVKPDESENEDDDEVYPVSRAESHLSLAFLDVNEVSTSFNSLDDPNNTLSVEEYLRNRWSRSSSLE